MPVRVALLRAINVGGHGNVSMANLRDFLAELGFDDARTLLNSGNLVFSSDQQPAEIETLLDTEAAVRLDLHTDFLVRTELEWAEIITRNPFREEAQRDPGHLLVLFLKGAPAAAAVEALKGAIVGREAIQAEGRQLYVTYPDGVGRSKLTNAVIEKKLGLRATGRNWNTVLKLQAAAQALRQP